MTKSRLNIANAFTLLNLFCGILAILALFMSKLWLVPFLIGISLLADVFDGLVARALHVQSPIGKELDSLADMISFGVLPSFLSLYVMLCFIIGIGYSTNILEMLSHVYNWQHYIFCFVALSFSMFAALRLAIFNISTNQSNNFIGLPTPAATIFVLGLYILCVQKKIEPFFLLKPIGLTITLFTLYYLMLSKHKMFSFKLKSNRLHENKCQILLVISSIMLIAFFKFAAVPLIIVVYVLINLTRKC